MKSHQSAKMEKHFVVLPKSLNIKNSFLPRLHLKNLVIWRWLKIVELLKIEN